MGYQLCDVQPTGKYFGVGGTLRVLPKELQRYDFRSVNSHSACLLEWQTVTLNVRVAQGISTLRFPARNFAQRLLVRLANRNVDCACGQRNFNVTISGS